MNEELLQIMVGTAAAVNALGLPVIFALLWRLHDQRSKLQEKRSYKATWEQVEALDRLLAWRGDVARSELKGLQEQLSRIRTECLRYDHRGQIRLVQDSRSDHREMFFVVGSHEPESLNRKVRELLAKAGTFQSDGPWEPLGQYEQLLRQALNKKPSVNPGLKTDAASGAA